MAAGFWTLVWPGASGIVQGSRCVIALWDLLVISLFFESMKGLGDGDWWHEED